MRCSRVHYAAVCPGLWALGTAAGVQMQTLYTHTPAIKLCVFTGKQSSSYDRRVPAQAAAPHQGSPAGAYGNAQAVCNFLAHDRVSSLLRRRLTHTHLRRRRLRCGCLRAVAAYLRANTRGAFAAAADTHTNCCCACVHACTARTCVRLVVLCTPNTQRYLQCIVRTVG